MAYLRSRGKASIALLMLMMFILPIATPLSSADADAAARNAVDIRIGDMLWTEAAPRTTEANFT